MPALFSSGGKGTRRSALPLKGLAEAPYAALRPSAASLLAGAWVRASAS
jgi:hypothetical protein